MALPFYMTLEGTTQGKIDGNCSAAGHEKEIECHALDQIISRPFDHKTGTPTGLRTHGPLRITKAFDKSSPKLYMALVTGERLKSVVLKFFRILPTGMPENYFTVTMTNAIIVEMHPTMANHLTPGNDKYYHFEDVGFTYGRIEWKWEPDSIVTMDEAISQA